MDKTSVKSKVLSGLFWKLLERGGTQGIQFVVQIVLARLLMPRDFGLIAILVIFIDIANVFVQSGFNTALIQKKDADERDFSSVFYLSLLVAGLLYIVLFFGSPFIAVFYQQPMLTLVIRVMSITLFFGAINSIQNAVIARNLQFKKLFYSSLGAIIISGAVGILMAYAGFGVWAIVVQQLSNNIVITLIMWLTVKWRPKLVFSIERVRELFSYGWKILVSVLINTMYTNLRSLVIGKLYSPEMLGYHNRGSQFPSVVVSNIDGSIQSVMLPTYSVEQDNRQRVKGMVRRSIVTSSFFLFPIMIGLAVVAEPLVKIVLTEKWLPCVPFLQIYCISYALYPIHTANLQAINALGQSGIYLKLEIIKKVLGLSILFISICFGVYAIALGSIVSGVISTVINSYPNRKLLGYSYKEQWKDIMPSMWLSLVMGIVIYGFHFMGLTSWMTILVQICLGIIIYIFMAWKFRLECFNYLVETFKEIFSSKKGDIY